MGRQPHRSDATAGGKPTSPRWLLSNLPCRSACPVGTHAGGYVSLVAAGRYQEAYLLARRPNPFASICGRICAHPCEAACRRQHLDAPVAIRPLKRFVTERYGVESGADFESIRQAVEQPREAATKPGRVAVIGAGPAGLSCAHDLALMGHEVVVLDAAPEPGGMMRMGIPDYRLPRDLIAREVGFIESLGVELRLGCAIGEALSFAELKRDYDAVFVAAGCRKGRSLPLPGMDLEGVITAIDFLVAVNLGEPMAIGDEVVVVGGGNVAFDVARTARRFGGTSEPDESHHNLLVDAATVAAKTLGKRVTLVSLESRDEMPADLEEIHEGLEEGVTLIHRRGPKEVLGEDGRVTALRTVAVTRVFDEEGRFSPQFAEDGHLEIACDTVIFAVGQIADLSFLGQDHGLEVTPRNTIVVDRDTMQTSDPRVFAGGDVAFGPRIVIEAVADGRRAAKGIDTLLTGRQDEAQDIHVKIFDSFGYDHPFAAGDYEHLDRRELPVINLARREAGVEVEEVLTAEQARHEGARCLHCWINTIFDSRSMSGSECIQCGGCVDVCPVDCIDLSSVRSGSSDQPLRTCDGQPIVLARHVDAPAMALIKDETMCIRCGLCARKCPVGCISMQGFYRGDEMKLIDLCERVI
ncbi:MAG: FAD-dependent oxidoreductase [Myxococcales bacterium]|nr:FAD-dependent oxidoreductase [Myxococcales bacterium]